MNLKSRIKEIEQRRQAEQKPIVVKVREHETHAEALDRVTGGKGAHGAIVIYIHGGLPDEH